MKTTTRANKATTTAIRMLEAMVAMNDSAYMSLHGADLVEHGPRLEAETAGIRARIAELQGR